MRVRMAASITAGVLFLGTVGAVTVAALSPRTPPPVSDKVAKAAAAPQPLPTVTATVGQRALVIGDSYTAGSGEGGMGAANWTKLADKRLDAKSPVDLTVTPQGGAGYVTPGTSGTTFAAAVPSPVAGPFDVIMVFGSRNDIGKPTEDIRAAAKSLYKALKAHSPKAKLVVVGAPWINDAPPAEIIPYEAALKAEATAAGGTFTDPVADGWFAGEAPDLIGADNVHPTDAGHRYMTGILTPILSDALAKAKAKR